MAAIIIIFTNSLPWQEQKEKSYVRILMKKRIAPTHKMSNLQCIICSLNISIIHSCTYIQIISVVLFK